MIKSKIFISSSEKAFVIADKLREELTTDYCEAEVWKVAIRANAGQTTIEVLEQLAKKYDYAVVVLAEEDVLVKSPVAELVNRDNCVFEAGLFLGALGRRKCFFLCSVDKNALPSDLDGIIYYRFTEPKIFTDREQCGQAIRSVAGYIKDIVQQSREQETRGGVVATRPLSLVELLEREQLEPDGELQEDEVVVASLQPLELNYSAASQVRKNLDGNIRYVYLFQANNDTADKIPQLLQLVMLADKLNPSVDNTFERRRELVKANGDEILRGLKETAENDKLNVYFLNESIDLEYCMHNAISDRFAKLYLKRGDDFFEWKSGWPAYNFWNEIRKKKGADTQDPGASIFHGTNDCQLKEGAFLRTLAMGMRKYFPDIGDQVLALCLGPDFQRKQAAVAGPASR
jgi:hypothetical protein